MLNNADLFQQLNKMEVKQIEVDQKFEQIFKALESREQQPEKGIFFEGQVFDAYTFVSGIIKKANKSVILIDNYADENVLTILAKRDKTVNATIYAKRIWLNLELAKKPIHCIEYIIVHELAHLLERTHNAHFIAIMDNYLPEWKHLKNELNQLPVSHVEWGF